MVGQAPEDTDCKSSFREALVAILKGERAAMSVYYHAYLIQFVTEEDMRMKAADSFHTSGLGMIHAGQEFEVHDALGKELADKGHATPIEASTNTAAGAKATEPAAKKEPAIINKMAEAPANKAAKPKPKDE